MNTIILKKFMVILFILIPLLTISKIAGGQCVDDNDCLLCEKCVALACVFQTNAEDTKNECPATICANGSCDGAGACTLEPNGTLCRASAGVCDVVENCTGASENCPLDALEPNGTTCVDGLFCTMTDVCQGGQCIGYGNPCPYGAACNEYTDTCKSITETSTTTSAVTTSSSSTTPTSSSTTPTSSSTTPTSSSTTSSTSLIWDLSYEKMWGIRKDEKLLLLRVFRDEILLNTKVGREYVSMLYDNSLEIATLLLQEPSLTIQTKEVVDELSLNVESLLYTDEIEIRQDTIDSFLSLLDDFEVSASPKLKAAIKKVKGEIKEDMVSEQLCITINE